MQTEYVFAAMNEEAANESLPAGAHQKAASAFVERARSEHGDDLIELHVFGSTVRGEASGRSSDVDVLVVLDVPVHPGEVPLPGEGRVVARLLHQANVINRKEPVRPKRPQ